MAIQITNNISTLDIDFDGNGDQYSINKANITLEKSGDYVVIVDSGRVPAKEYKVLYTDVTPVPTSADALYATILGYLNNGGGGDATAGNQLTIISELQDVNTELDNISATDFATSAKQEDVKTKLDTIITNTDLGENASMTDVLVDDLGDTLLSANTQRKEAIIYNRGTNLIWISYDNSPAVDKGFLLDKKEFLIEDRYVGIISAIAETGKTTNINITEVTL